MPWHLDRNFINIGIFIVHIHFIDHIHLIRLRKVESLTAKKNKRKVNY